MTDINDNGLQKGKILDIKTVITLGVMLASMSAAWANMAARVDRITGDIEETKRGYYDADQLIRAQVAATNSDISDVKASLSGIQRDLFYIRQAVTGGGQ